MFEEKAGMKKPRKIQLWELPTLPRTLAELSEIESGALLGSIWQPGDTQERSRDAQEAPKTGRELPKSEQKLAK